MRKRKRFIGLAVGLVVLSTILATPLATLASAETQDNRGTEPSTGEPSKDN